MKCTIIGVGNVGFHLIRRMNERDIFVKEVFTRSTQKAFQLDRILDVPFVHDIHSINPSSDLYILAVPDKAIEAVSQKLSTRLKDNSNALVVHTSGATPMEVLKPYFENYGSFYPLQTFSIRKKADFTKIPICIDAKKETARNLLEDLGLQLGSKVYQISDQQRAILHVAAVFVNNFSNYLFHVGQDILEQEKIPFDLLKPLILETALKVQTANPKAMQTGPAIRKDSITIERHLKYLKTHPKYLDLYHLLTELIQNNC